MHKSILAVKAKLRELKCCLYAVLEETELLEEERESGMTDRELEKQQAHLIDYIKALEWVTGDKETL